MHLFTTIFLATLAVVTLLRIWLELRQIAYVRARRFEVPAAFAEKISIDEHQKAADYTLAGTRTGIVDTLVDTAWLLLLTFGGVLALLDSFWRDMQMSALATGIAVMFSAFMLSWLISLPLSLYRTFGIEARFGFNRTTPALYLADTVKSLVLMFLLGVPLLAAILWIMEHSGGLWWLYAWGVWVTFSLTMTWAYPAFIAPIFNKFSPLENADLKERIEALLARCGFTSKGVFVMDGSRRSAHGNAYFTGLGNNKRIVFFDTLMESLEGREIEAVLAHELGHFRMHHVRKRLAVVFATSLAGLALLGWLSEQPWFYSSLGIEQPSSWMALMLFILIMPVFTFLLTPLGSLFSRRHEFEADEYAARQSNAADLADALVKLYQDNATTLTPDPLHSTFYDSHPPAPIRISRLQQLSA